MLILESNRTFTFRKVVLNSIPLFQSVHSLRTSAENAHDHGVGTLLSSSQAFLNRNGEEILEQIHKSSNVIR